MVLHILQKLNSDRSSNNKTYEKEIQIKFVFFSSKQTFNKSALFFGKVFVIFRQFRVTVRWERYVEHVGFTEKRQKLYL